MITHYLKEMRNSRQAIRNGNKNVLQKWREDFKRRQRNYISRLKKKVISEEYINELVNVGIENDCDFKDLASIYYTSHNPVVAYHQGRFSFSISGLKEALKNELETDSLSCIINDYFPGQCKINYKIRRNSSYYSYETWDYYLSLGKRIINYCKTMYVTLFKITYHDIEMDIYRFHIKGCYSGRIYVFPSLQLSNFPVEMDEISFFQMDIPSLLLDMYSENKERKIMISQIIEYGKNGKLNLLGSHGKNDEEAINILFWNEEQVSLFAEECIKKRYDMDTSIRNFLDELLAPLKKYFLECASLYPNSMITKFYGDIIRGEWFITCGQFIDVRIYISNKESTYTLTFSGKKFSSFALEQFLTKVEEYGNLWKQLTKIFKTKYLKYKRINLLEQNLK